MRFAIPKISFKIRLKGRNITYRLINLKINTHMMSDNREKIKQFSPILQIRGKTRNLPVKLFFY